IWLALAFGGVLSVHQLLAGFGSEAVLLVGSMMAVAEGLRRVGATQRLARYLLRHAGGSERRARVVFTLTGAVLAALLETTAGTVSLLPMIARLGKDGPLRPQRLYLMGAIGAMAGGVVTLIGTSGNVVANGVLAGMGQPGFGFLELARLGGFAVAIALLYALTLAGRLLPRPSGVALDQAISALRAYVAEVRVQPDSRWAGRTLREAALRAEEGVDVLAILRDGQRRADPGPDEQVLAGDVLLVTGPAAHVVGLTALPDAAAVAPAAEGLIPPGSPWVGSTLANLRARAAGLRVLGIWRHGETLAGRLGNLRLSAGDVLLVRGDHEALLGLQTNGHIAWLNPVASAAEERRPGSARRLGIALAILAGFVAAAASGRVDLALASFAAAVAMVLGGTLEASGGYGAVQWKVLVLLAGVIPLGAAISATGLATTLARGLLAIGHHWGPGAALAGLCIAATLLTQALSNVPAAAVMTPVAVRLALGSGLSVKAAVAAMLVAVLCTPLSGLASKPAILVREAGGYRSADYLRIGLPFSIACVAAAVLLAPWLWPGPG
ncbi:MAG TPA: SLC13 family permease, partial [Bacillota bacterium]|nr:SLC13 family permease [Bacillota bacterium]